MKKVIVDTDVVVDYLRTGQGDLPKLMASQAKGSMELVVSTVTVMELYAGRFRAGEGENLERVLAAVQVVPFDRELAVFSGEYKRERKLTLALFDFVIGMTCLWMKGTLVTRNKKHFEQIPGVKLWRG